MYNRRGGSSRQEGSHARNDRIHLSGVFVAVRVGQGHGGSAGGGSIVDALREDPSVLPAAPLAMAHGFQLKTHFKRRLPLHSQAVQALIEKFCATIDGVRTKRKNGDKQTRYPWRFRRYYNPIFKGQAIKREGSSLILPLGRGRDPIRVSSSGDHAAGRDGASRIRVWGDLSDYDAGTA